MSSYAFDNSVALQSSERFDSLQRCYDPVTLDRLAEFDIGSGWSCLEVGAGAGSVARWLGERVAPGGSVTTTDIDVRLIGEVGDNVEVLTHDIVSDPLPEASFDLVHARLVLLHLPERRRALDRMWHALKPGGVLVLDEFDCTWLPVLAAPDHTGERLFHTVVDGIHELLRRAGADLAWGRNAYRALVDADYVDLDVRGYSEVWRGGSVGAHLHRANAQQTSDRLQQEGLASGPEVKDFLALIEDPGFAVSSYLMLSTSGRRPA